MILGAFRFIFSYNLVLLFGDIELEMREIRVAVLHNKRGTAHLGFVQ